MTAKVKVWTATSAFGFGIVLALGLWRLVNVHRGPVEIIPAVKELDRFAGHFTITPTMGITTGALSRSEAEMLAERLRRSTGYAIPLRAETSEVNQQANIVFTTEGADATLGPEGYGLTVTRHRVILNATDSAGFFYGMQTLLQLLSPSIFSKQPLPAERWDMPCLRIQDKPRFKWRGFMLDVSRHFFTPAEIKQLLDAIAFQKLNIFHWHLTDDQGWRIEVKKYPRLTDVGAWRKGVGFNLDPKSTTAYGPDGRYGGYYTQAEVRDLVSYARARHITIVPEIDVPGHSSAALSAYREFSCSGGPYSTDMSVSVAAGILCPGKEETFEFVDNILVEVMDIFPGQFIHIGGDEVSKQNWRNCPKCRARMVQEGLSDVSELQRYFTRRIEKFADSHGKRVVGWSEIRADDLSKSSVIMDWTGGGPEAARSGHDVVMAPEDYCYLDLYQSRNRNTEPPAAGAYLPLRKVYGFEPVPAGLTLEEQRHVLGAQANLWTEYISSFAQVEYMTFPRLCALSEVVWSPKESQSWEDFKHRLVRHEQRLNQLGINYRRDK